MTQYDNANDLISLKIKVLSLVTEQADIHLETRYGDCEKTVEYRKFRLWNILFCLATG